MSPLIEEVPGEALLKEKQKEMNDLFNGYEQVKELDTGSAFRAVVAIQKSMSDTQLTIMSWLFKVDSGNDKQHKELLDLLESIKQDSREALPWKVVFQKVIVKSPLSAAVLIATVGALYITQAALKINGLSVLDLFK